MTSRKKSSNFTSAMRPNGACMNASIAPADIVPTATRKKPSSRYLSARSGRSIQRGRRKLRPNNARPAFQSASDSVPIGHSQAQKLRLSSALSVTKATNSTIAAG